MDGWSICIDGVLYIVVEYLYGWMDEWMEYLH